jgi:pilus assembly protein CpaE
MALASPQQPAPAKDDGTDAARVPLIAFVRDRDTLTVLSEVLSPALGPTAEFRLGTVEQAASGVRRLGIPVSAILVDVSGELDPLGALEKLALFVEPGVRVFVIGDIENIDFYRQVTRSLGVQEYLFKPLNRDVVARNLLPILLGGSTAATRTGRIVAVTGVRGGVGATTVAVNLAVQLAQRSRHHVLLFDPNLNNGTTALMLGARPAGGLREALENPARVDRLFAERSAPALNDRLHLLAGEEPLDDIVMPAAGATQHLATILCNRFNFLVTDLPSYPTPLNQELNQLIHVRVLVMDATLPSLRDALRHMSLSRGPRQASRSIVVLNRVGLSGSLTHKQVVDGLGTEVDVVIPWLPKQMTLAMTLGEPALRHSKPVAAAMMRLANEILPHRPIETPPTPWFRSLPWMKS